MIYLLIGYLIGCILCLSFLIVFQLKVLKSDVKLGDISTIIATTLASFLGLLVVIAIICSSDEYSDMVIIKAKK